MHTTPKMLESFPKIITMELNIHKTNELREELPQWSQKSVSCVNHNANSWQVFMNTTAALNDLEIILWGSVVFVIHAGY